MVQELINILGSEARVGELIDRDLNWWNVPLVNSVFPRGIAEKICGLAICPRLQQDRVIWVGTKNGVFSVRSTYHLDLEY